MSFLASKRFLESNAQSSYFEESSLKLPPSPLLVFLNNVGQLITYYVCNIQSTGSLCKPITHAIPQPKIINPEQPLSQPPVQPAAPSSFSFNAEPQAPKPLLPNPQWSQSTPTVKAATTTKVESQPKPAVVAAKQSDVKESKPISSVNIEAHIKAFTDELNGFREKIKQNRLFSNKNVDISSADKLKEQYKCLIDENLFKETNAIKQKFNDLNNKMKVRPEIECKTSALTELGLLKLTKRFDTFTYFAYFCKTFTDNCLDLREDLIATFDTLEKLKVYREHLTDTDYMNLLLKRDLNPATKSRYDDVKNLFNYIDREINNINYLICEKNRAKQDRLAELIPNERVFEILRHIDTSVNQFNKEINQIIGRLKFMKMNSSKYNRYFHLQNRADVNLEMADDVPSLNSLCNQMENIEIYKSQSSSTKNVVKQLSSTAFYSQLHDVLKKRKQIPIQNKSLYSLDFVNKKFDDEKSVQIQGDLSFIASPQVAKPMQAVSFEKAMQQPKPAAQIQEQQVRL